MSPTPQPKQKLTIQKILRAVVIGSCAYWILGHIPAIFLLVTHASRNNQNIVEDDEPIYRDKDGKRINYADYHLLVGYETAQQENITEHAACKMLYGKPEEGLKRTGCSRYVSSQKVQPPHVRQGNWDGGKTTAECEAEVNAYWSVGIQDLRERGDDHAANSWTRRDWVPELAECKNYDNVRIGKVVFEPLARLQEILRRLDQGGGWTEQDREIVQKDIEQVRAFPEHETRTEYLEKAARFFRIVDGIETPNIPSPLLLSCDEFRRKIDEFRKADQQDSKAQAALKKDGVIVDSQQFAKLNQGKLDRLWDFKRYSDGAQAAGCSIPSLER